MICESCANSVHRCCSGVPCECGRCSAPSGHADPRRNEALVAQLRVTFKTNCSLVPERGEIAERLRRHVRREALTAAREIAGQMGYEIEAEVTE